MRKVLVEGRDGINANICMSFLFKFFDELVFYPRVSSPKNVSRDVSIQIYSASYSLIRQVNQSCKSYMHVENLKSFSS